MKKCLILFIICLIAMTISACESPKDKVYEYDIRSIKVESRAITNGYGGVQGYYTVYAYSYISNDSIKWDEENVDDIEVKESEKNILVISGNEWDGYKTEILLTKETLDSLK